ncbi:hypothetical protein SAICODRAFT_27746 [Saitoella complicata NRRL Y-17804]|uniref:DNA replication factor Cdt1 C-terminal domain-containing protein n=1 Tax=Saitoella complicata (strain BCRC 22490 / CBS 7301 / JCM 7358 / NBRC 10748 / NRRL Y-17804) TaxID=698492 RepID=A0A0E9NRS4_SAICN|nr:uncharacterized protein SAICODRAFT_27746 [Saitoella complicata NRRL Y-17804]ODQ50301.1 hypothetical protein SAICODRAFT_27746 [Saitoella complicata NRRL Y-17804]GAO52130.1 hypothetical protein G7K_6216-t1 [Saitoella complicata NRRL Y-17804]
MSTRSLRSKRRAEPEEEVGDVVDAPVVKRRAIASTKVTKETRLPSPEPEEQLKGKEKARDDLQLLIDHFSALTSTLLLHTALTSSTPPSFAVLKRQIEATTGRTFSLLHLQQIKGVWDKAFVWEMGNAGVVVELPKGVGVMDIDGRVREFEKRVDELLEGEVPVKEMPVKEPRTPRKGKALATGLLTPRKTPSKPTMSPLKSLSTFNEVEDETASPPTSPTKPRRTLPATPSSRADRHASLLSKLRAKSTLAASQPAPTALSPLQRLAPLLPDIVAIIHLLLPLTKTTKSFSMDTICVMVVESLGARGKVMAVEEVAEGIEVLGTLNWGEKSGERWCSVMTVGTQGKKAVRFEGGWEMKKVLEVIDRERNTGSTA